MSTTSLEKLQNYHETSVKTINEITSLIKKKYDKYNLSVLPPRDINQIIRSIIKNLSEYDRIRVASLLVVEKPAEVSQTIQSFKIKKEEDRLKIAIAAASLDGKKASKFIKEYDLQENSRVVVAKVAARHKGEETSILISEYEIKSILSRIDIAKIALLNDVNSLQYLNKYFPDDDLPSIKKNPRVKDIEIWLQLVSAKMPNIFPPAVVGIYSDMKRRDAGIKLLAGYLGKDMSKSDKDGSRQALQNLTGLSINNLLLSERSSNTRGDLYEILLDIQAKYPTPCFDEIKIDNNIELSVLMPFFTNLNMLVQIASNNTKSIDLIKKKLMVIRTENIKELTLHIQSLIIEMQETITNKEIKELLLKWDNIESILSLIARFEGKPSWRIELPILKRIIKMELNNKFSELKYHGYPEDKYDKEQAVKQTECMTQAQLEIWKKNTSSLEVFSHSYHANSDNILLKKTEEILNPFLNKLSSTDAETFSKHLQNIKNKRGKTLQNCLKDLFVNDINKMQSFCLYFINKASSSLELKERVVSIKSIWDFLKFDQGLKDEINLISNLLYDKKNKNKTIVFTTTIDDARSLLEIGNLVNTSSCLNFRNGSHIHTLLGSAIDSNTKAIASFAISSNENLSNHKFAQVCHEIENNKEINYEYDPKKKVLKATLSNEEVIYIHLDKAFYRQIIKVGETDYKTTGIGLEPKMIQSWEGSDFMKHKVDELINYIARQMGVSLNLQINVHKSRNPSGSYSGDGAIIGQGIKTTNYKL